MRASLAAAVGLLAWAAWDTRRRWAPAALLDLVGDGETDSAPDLVDQAEALPELLTMADSINAQANRAAFLAMLASCEGTVDAGGYRTLYGSTPSRVSTFVDYTDHPAELGWPGVRLTDQQCRGAGLSAGCVSTAAGLYQITCPTWRRIRAKLGLQDFGPEAQDAAAIELIRERGALAAIDAGRLDDAINLVRKVWASLPGAGYEGQGTRTLSWARTKFAAAGGTIA